MSPEYPVVDTKLPISALACFSKCHADEPTKLESKSKTAPGQF